MPYQKEGRGKCNQGNGTPVFRAGLKGGMTLI